MSNAPTFDYSTYHRLDSEYNKIINPPGSFDKTGKYIGLIKLREFLSENNKNEEQFKKTYPTFSKDEELHKKYDPLFEKETLKEHEYNRLPSIFKDGIYYKETKKKGDSYEFRGTGIDHYSNELTSYTRLQSPEIMWNAWFQTKHPTGKGGRTNKRRKLKKRSKRRRTLKY
jgi:hypothetical protein